MPRPGRAAISRAPWPCAVAASSTRRGDGAATIERRPRVALVALRVDHDHETAGPLLLELPHHQPAVARRQRPMDMAHGVARPVLPDAEVVGSLPATRRLVHGSGVRRDRLDERQGSEREDARQHEGPVASSFARTRRSATPNGASERSSAPTVRISPRRRGVRNVVASTRSRRRIGGRSVRTGSRCVSRTVTLRRTPRAVPAPAAPRPSARLCSASSGAASSIESPRKAANGSTRPAANAPRSNAAITRASRPGRSCR